MFYALKKAYIVLKERQKSTLVENTETLWHSLYVILDQTLPSLTYPKKFSRPLHNPAEASLTLSLLVVHLTLVLNTDTWCQIIIIESYQKFVDKHLGTSKVEHFCETIVFVRRKNDRILESKVKIHKTSWTNILRFS